MTLSTLLNFLYLVYLIICYNIYIFWSDNMPEKKKIIIIEDQPLLNSMMKEILSKDFNIVGTSTSAKDMLQLCDKYKPDLVLTDVVTKDNVNGISYSRKVKGKYKQSIKILAITGIPEISFLNKAKDNNLDGLIYKDISSSTLISSVEQVLQGYTLFPDNYIHSDNNERFNSLTEKEVKILKLLCEGIDREYIAKKVNITPGTLKNYISNILNKLNFDSVSKLTIFCVSNGYIVPDIN